MSVPRYLLSAFLLLLGPLQFAKAFQVAPLFAPPAAAVLRSEEASSSSTSQPSPTTEETKADESVPLPPVIQRIADDQREYQMNVGKAMDVLRRDYQDILREKPDFSIYDSQIRLVDPSGVQLTGLDKYKSAIAFFQGFLGFWFATKKSKSSIQFRIMYDFCRAEIRVSWNCILWPKLPGMRPLHVDGISLYPLNRTTGQIVEHRIEKLVINNRHAEPPYNVLVLLQQDLVRIRQPSGGGVPAGVGALSGAGFQ